MVPAGGRLSSWTRLRFFPVPDPKELMNRHRVLASEYHIVVDDDMPIYRFQQLSDAAIAQRNERIEAAKEGRLWVG